MVVILTGYGVYKKYHVNIVLLLAGLVLNLLAVAGGVGNILPKGTTSTGLEWFDIFELFRAVSRSQVASTGFIILIAGGFAAYMDKIGASGRLVRACLSPLQKLSMPYLVLGSYSYWGIFWV